MFSRKIKYAAVAAVLSVTLCTGCSLFHKEDPGQKEIDSEIKEDDEIIVKCRKLKYGKTYKYTIRGIRLEGMGEYVTLKGKFRAVA